MSILANIANHWEVARAAWRDEKARETRGEDKQGHEREFLPAVLEVTETPASPVGRAVAIVIMVFFNVALTWAVFGEIDIISIAQGKIIPAAQVKTIQPLEHGVIREILIKDGDAVTAGQVLIELDPTGTEADTARLENEYRAARLEVARLSALLADDPQAAYEAPPGVPEQEAEEQRVFLLSQWHEHRAKLLTLTSEIRRYEAEAATAEADIKRLERLLPKVKKRVESRRGLAEKGVVPKLDFIELEEQLIDKEGELDVQRRKLPEARANIEAAKARRDQAAAEFRRDIVSRLSEARTKAASTEQELIKARERGRLQRLVAPVDGVVQQLAVHTVGGVVTPAQELMVIVPADTELEIEVQVENKDIGFVREGQEAEIKVDAFQFTKYGTIPGTVRTLSRDAVQDEKKGLIYPARVTMGRTTMQVGKEDVNLGPGMSATVEIKTGKRRIIEYLLAPLQRYQDESMRER